MNPLEIVLEQMNEGVDVEIKRQHKDGYLEPIKDKELASLKTKSLLATTSQLIQKLDSNEKLEWAIETKNEGNELFRQQDYQKAMEKYVEALAATDFGQLKPMTAPVTLSSTSSPNIVEVDENGNEIKDELPIPEIGNVDSLVIPILNNLASCCIQLKQWNKVVLFSQQALSFRSNCHKAKYRHAQGLLNMGDHDECIKILKELYLFYLDRSASNSSDLKSDVTFELSEQEIQKLPKLLKLAAEERIKAKKQSQEQKVAMQKAFNWTPPSFHTNESDEPPPLIPMKKKKIEPMSLTEALIYLLELLWNFLMRLLGLVSKNKND